MRRESNYCTRVVLSVSTGGVKVTVEVVVIAGSVVELADTTTDVMALVDVLPCTMALVIVLVVETRYVVVEVA
jgi:hypothetical protein